MNLQWYKAVQDRVYDDVGNPTQIRFEIVFNVTFIICLRSLFIIIFRLIYSSVQRYVYDLIIRGSKCVI